MSVKEKLKGLLSLQKVDLEILELKRAGAVHPKRLAELDADLAKFRSAVESERTRLTENDKRRLDKANEVQSEKDKVKKWEARLAEQRTTREYAALAREIDIAKKAVENLEEEVKGLVADSGTIKKVLGDREAELRRREDATAAERATLSEQVATLDSQVSELEEKRASLAKKVDATLAVRYDQVRKNKGSGVAAVINGTCRGCNMRILPQLYNILRAGTLETCPSCQRLIYASELMEGEQQ